MPVVAFILTHNALRPFEQQKDRKCDPGLITVGAAISENSELRADKEVSVQFPVGCFVRCGCMNVSLCVKNEQFALSTCHIESVTKKPPHELRDDFESVFLRIENSFPK